ncbi:FHA domain-containing protein [Streptomyces sp. NPDC005202]|uniref:FHA domain-containing protein n=1 Tax=Streptomyces sp. NPDC005202 TaxID=3157021 RepID=UPI0033B7C38A
MQIRLTVVDPLGPHSPRLSAPLEQGGPRPSAQGRAASCDVLVTAPAGTALAAVASALAAAVAGEAGASERSREPGAGPVVLYAGAERLDPQRCTLGEPPLLDGAVLSLGAPAEPEPHPELDDAPTQLHVVAGPDAGGVHLLHGGQITVGRSADADVPLDDPDVSRLHCAVTVAPDGRVSVADLGSTNGTVLDGTRVGIRPVRFTPGALLRIGESALRLTPAGGPGARVETAPDGEGHVRVPSGGERGPGSAAGAGSGGTGSGAAAGSGGAGVATTVHARVRGSADGTVSGAGTAGSAPSAPPADAGGTRAPLPHGSASWGASGDAPGAQEHGPVEFPVVPAQGHAPRIESHGSARGTAPRDGASSAPDGGGDTYGGRFAVGGHTGAFTAENAENTDGSPSGTAARAGRSDGAAAGGSGRKKTPLRGTDVLQGVRRRGGLGAWARRLAGGRGEQATTRRRTYDDGPAGVTAQGLSPAYAGPQLPETWPDPAALLLTALGPGPRLWERGPGHPEALTVRLGTADRAALDGSGLLPAVPVTTDLREVGALGLAGPRARLSGVARAVLAQLAALHSPDTLEIVLLSADHTRPLEERTAEWSWLGWLPHLRPGHGQDCRLLLAYDREQATARTEELLRRLEDHLAETRGATGPAPRGGRMGATTYGSGTVVVSRAPEAESALGEPGRPGAEHRTPPSAADGAQPTRGAVRRPSWARDNDGAGELGFAGPYTVVVVDGDPGGAAVREAVARLAHEGPRAGIHVLCLAETAPAPPASPVTDTYEAACAGSPVFRECGAVALLSGDVATALRLMRVAPSGAAPGAAEGPYAPRGTAAHPHPGPAAARRSDAPLTHRGTAQDAHPTTSAAGTAHATTSTAASTQATTSTAENTHATTTSTTAANTHPAAAGTGHPTAPTAGHPHTAPDPRPSPVAPGTLAVVDAVSLAWAERFARALAPLRTDGAAGDRRTRVSAPLPLSARLLDELGLARATPASLLARWADAADDTAALGGRAWAVLGAGPRGPVCADLVADGPHLLIEGPAGSGRTELLRSVVASLAAAERPDRLGIVLMDGRDGVGAGSGHGDGLRACTDVPHVTTHLTANDPVRMREFAQSLSAELKRRAELLGRADFAEWHTRREVSGRIVAQRTASGRTASGARTGDVDTPPSSTLRLRPAAAGSRTEAAPPLPRLVVVVDDLDALVSPALGSPGRPAAGSVIRALEAVAREGERLGVHLVTAAGPGGRTAETEPARRATLRVTLDAPSSGPDEPAPGRGRLTCADGRVTPFQGGRVTGRIPRTATQRPTVVTLEWRRMGDPPARRSVRELGNGPTDLALLASALERAAREVSAAEVPSLL